MKTKSEISSLSSGLSLLISFICGIFWSVGMAYYSALMQSPYNVFENFCDNMSNIGTLIGFVVFTLLIWIEWYYIVKVIITVSDTHDIISKMYNRQEEIEELLKKKEKESEDE